MVTVSEMRLFLSRSYSSVNRNKINGIYAEVDFYRHISELGFADRLSPGGWIMRPVRVPQFGTQAVAVFPCEVPIGQELPGVGIGPPNVTASVDAAANFLAPANIQTYYCYPVQRGGEIAWYGLRRGVPTPFPAADLRELLAPAFVRRERQYNFLSNSTDVSELSDQAVVSQFPLESLRVYIAHSFYAEISDIDRLLWGTNTIYPVEIKEKTRATDRGMGDWFGLDAGPFTKLAYFAAWYGQLKSLFVVREIVDTETRELTEWWAIEFGNLAKHASWVYRGGGPNMLGGASATIRVPLHAFSRLDAQFVEGL